MSIICKICSQGFENDAFFHKHLRSHKTTQTIYYQTYFPRQDRYDGSIILYKNRDYYFSTDFNSRGNLKKWLNSVTPETARNYIRDFLVKRKQKKNLIYFPTQTELKTLLMPGLKYINEKLGGYRKLAEELGLKVRFNEEKLNLDLFTDISKRVIFADKREQQPLEFDNTTRSKSMSFGDYRMANCSVYVERKSIADAFGTLTGGYRRFNKEIIRAKEAKAYLIVLIEGNFNELEVFPQQRQVRGKIKIPVEFVWHSIREIYYNYDMVQFLFVKNREEASRVIQKIFSAGEQVRKCDLQYLYDVSEL